MFSLLKISSIARDCVFILYNTAKSELMQEKESLSISELIKEMLNKTGYTKALQAEDRIEAESRIENLEEFLTVAIEFEEQEVFSPYCSAFFIISYIDIPVCSDIFCIFSMLVFSQCKRTRISSSIFSRNGRRNIPRK